MALKLFADSVTVVVFPEPEASNQVTTFGFSGREKPPRSFLKALVIDSIAGVGRTGSRNSSTSPNSVFTKDILLLWV